MQIFQKIQNAISAENWTHAERHLRQWCKQKNAPAQAFYNLAKVLEKQDKHEQAEIWLKRAIAIDNGYVSAIFELGRYETLFGKMDRAFRLLKRAKSLAPHDEDVLNLYYQVAIGLGKWADAYEVLQHLPQSVKIRASLYRVKCELGLLDERSRSTWIKEASNAEMLQVVSRVSKGTLPFSGF